MVDGTGLENRHTRKGIGGSNPSLSAIYESRKDVDPMIRNHAELDWIKNELGKQLNAPALLIR